MPLITNSSAAAAAPATIRIRLRSRFFGGTPGTGPDPGTGAGLRASHGRLDPLTDAVCANMSGDGGGVAAVGSPGGVGPGPDTRTGPDGSDNGGACVPALCS